MRVAFWISLATIVYAYFGYAVLLSLYASVHKRPIHRQPITPTVSILIAARNEEKNLPGKLEHLRLLDYPPQQFEIIIVSDGSTDRTANILRENDPWVQPIILPESLGKANALNQAVLRATGEILVFLDARQSVDRAAVSELVSCFADEKVGAVSGELLLEDSAGLPSSDALGIYWRLEKLTRRLESATGSVVGVTGAIYAVRRELFTALPPDTILDDVFIPMNVVRRNKRVVFHSPAIARDLIFKEKRKEFSRKVRTLAGNYQLLRLAPWLLTPANPLLFRLISHKLLRLIVPLLLVVMLVTSGLARGRFYTLTFCLQLIFYALAAIGAWMPSIKRFKPVAIAGTFVMLNAAAALAFYHFIFGRKRLWT